MEHGALVATGVRLARRQMPSYSCMSWRRVRESHATIVGGPTIIWPIIAPSISGGPHMMRHHDLPSNTEALG